MKQTINQKVTYLILLILATDLVFSEDCQYSGVHITLGDNFASKKCTSLSASNSKTLTCKETKTIRISESES